MCGCLTLTLGTLLASIPPATAQPWTSERGELNNQASLVLSAPETQPQPWIQEADDHTWAYQAGVPVWSSPALLRIDDRAVLFAGSYDHQMIAIDASTGEERFTFTAGGAIVSAPLIAPHDDGDYLIFAASDRRVYALDASSGQQLWVHALAPWRPTLGHGRLLTGAMGQVGDRSAVFVGYWLYDRSLMAGQQEGGVVALDADTGAELWRQVLGDSAVTAPRFVDDGQQARVLIGGQDGRLQALDASTGRVLWTHTSLDALLAAPAIFSIDGQWRVAVAGKSGILRCLTLVEGRELWRYKAGDRVTGSPVLFDRDGHPALALASLDRTLHAVDAGDGHGLWRYWAKAGLFGAPAFLPGPRGGVLAVAAWDHHLHGVSARHGRLLWLAYTGRPLWQALALDELAASSPVLLRLGQIDMAFMGSYSGAFYGLRLDRLNATSDARAPSNLAFAVSLGIVLLSVLLAALVLSARYRRR